MEENAQELRLKQKSVSFYGDHLLVLETATGNVFISMSSLCDALSLNVTGQVQRIQRSAVMRVSLQRLPVQTGGGIQRIWCLHQNGIEAWMEGFTISKLKPAAREKLPRYTQLLTYLQTDQGEWTQTAQAADKPVVHKQEKLVSASTVILEVERAETVVSSDPEPTSDEALRRQMLAILSNVYPPEITPHITTTSSQIDQTIREASFADKWDLGTYRSSTDLQVYLGSRKTPLDITDAQTKIRQIGGSTALTGRLVMGFWNLRRNEHGLSLNGRVGVRVDEILAWRGLQKHQRPAYTGNPTRLRSDGYRSEHKQQVIRDLDLLSSCCVRGTITLMVNGRPKRIYVDGPYLDYSTVSVETGNGEEVIGFFIAPGDWIHTFDELAFRAEIDQRIFQLHPQNEQHELRLALFLVEEWRRRALEKQQDLLFKMDDLLLASMITVDEAHITRFADRIERAIGTLKAHGILSEESMCMEPVDRTKTRWADAWLQSRWRLVPPTTIVERYTSWDQGGSKVQKRILPPGEHQR